MPKVPAYPIGESFPDPVFIVDPNRSEIEWMNNAAEVWLGRPFSTMQGRSLVEIGFGFDEVVSSIQNAPIPTRSFKGYDLHVSVRRTDYVCRYQLFKSGNKIAVHFDPIEKGILAPRSKGADNSVSMLGNMLAHELKNPLAGIRGAAQLLDADLTSTDDRELTALIKTEVDRIGRLAERLENFGQSDFSDHKAVNVHEVLRKARLLFDNQTDGKIEIIEEFDPSIPDVHASTDGLMQVVVNLVSNAIDAIKADGLGDQIWLKTGYRTGVKKRSRSGENRSLPIEIKIIDNGPGIPAHLKDRIFQPFVTSKANGQGLGLALISKIVDDHDGIIQVGSEPGRTVFSVLLPSNSPNQNKA